MINLIPANDLMPHSEGSTCECLPYLIMEEGEMIFVHSSFDGRENEEEEMQNSVDVKRDNR